MRFCKNIAIFLMYAVMACGLSACGFHLQGETHLAAPLHRMYLQTQDPYGPLAHFLQEYLKMSHVQLVESPELATSILVIENDRNSQSLLSVSATQQTRQYNLAVNVSFFVTNNTGKVLVAPQSFTEARTLTIQSNQVLGSSNEATNIYQQIRRSLATAIINRLSSQEITDTLNKVFLSDVQPRHVTQGKQKKP